MDWRKVKCAAGAAILTTLVFAGAALFLVGIIALIHWTVRVAPTLMVTIAGSVLVTFLLVIVLAAMSLVADVWREFYNRCRWR